MSAELDELMERSGPIANVVGRLTMEVDLDDLVVIAWAVDSWNDNAKENGVQSRASEAVADLAKRLVGTLRTVVEQTEAFVAKVDAGDS